MKRLLAASMLLSAAAFAEENQAPVVVISPIAGFSRGASMAGGLLGFYRDEGRLRYGLTVLATGGTSCLGGASLDARWSFFEAQITPYLGMGIGAFQAWNGSADLGIQPAATFEGGVEWRRFFAGARVQLPLATRTTGVDAHDAPGVGAPVLLAQLGFAL